MTRKPPVQKRSQILGTSLVLKDDVGKGQERVLARLGCGAGIEIRGGHAARERAVPPDLRRGGHGDHLIGQLKRLGERRGVRDLDHRERGQGLTHGKAGGGQQARQLIEQRRVDNRVEPLGGLGRVKGPLGEHRAAHAALPKEPR